jgi:branched-chain amino acid transport system permease protein
MAYLVFPLLCRDAKYILGVVTNASVLSFISLGVWVTFAIGRINISQGAYALIGGYTAAILSTRYGVSFWVGLPLSGAIAAAVGGLLGWAILRLRGVYFAMITLSLTEAARLAFLNGGELTQGALGIVNIPRPQALSVAGVTLIPAFEGAAPLAFYYLSATLLGMGLLVVWRLSTSRLGGVFRALRQNEELAASLGIQIAKYRVIAYGVCCGMGGLGGAFFAAYHQNIYPGSYTVTDSVTFMLYCFVGGLDYVLNQTTEDWHTGCVTLSGAKGLVCRRDASPTAQHDSRPWSSQVYQCRVVRFRGPRQLDQDPRDHRSPFAPWVDSLAYPSKPRWC